MLVNPYDTTLGKIFSVEKIISEVKKYMVLNDGDLSYEYLHGEDTKLVFITGKNNSEIELPIWNHPIATTDTKGGNIVLVDLRTCVKVKNEFAELSEVVSNEPVFEFEILRAVLTAQLLDGNTAVVKSFEKTLISAFTLWVSKILATALVLNPLEKTKLNAVIAYYVISLLHVAKEPLELNNACIKIKNAKFDLPTDIKLITEVIGKIEGTKIVDADGLSTIIRNANISPKLATMTTDAIQNLLYNTWFGNKSVEVVALSLEHLPTMFSMFYAAVENKTYRKTKLSNILSGHSRAIDTKEFVKNVKILIKESKV